MVTSAIFAVTGCSQASGSGDDSSDSTPTFKTYTTSNGLKSNSIKTIVVNNTGVYVGTDGGLSVTTDGGSTWKTYTVADGLISNSINSIYVGGDYMLIATDKGFSETGDNGKTWKTKSIMGSWSFVYDRDYDKIHFLSGDYVCTTTDFSSWSRYCVRRADMPTCVIMASGKVFVSYFGSNITVSSDGGSNWSTCSSGLGSQFVNSLSSSGTTVYAATLGGLSVSTDSGASWTTYTTANGLANDNVGCVAATDSNIYIGVSKSGMYVSSDGGKSWKQYTTLDGLPSNSVNCIAVSGKTVYVGTDSGLAILQ